MALQTSLLYVTSKDNKRKQCAETEQCLPKLEDFIINKIVKIECYEIRIDNSKREKVAELDI